MMNSVSIFISSFDIFTVVFLREYFAAKNVELYLMSSLHVISLPLYLPRSSLIQQGINTRAYISLSYFLRIKKINLTKLTYYNKASENQVMKLHSNTCFFRSSLIFVSFIEIFLIEIFIEIKRVFRIYNK